MYLYIIVQRAGPDQRRRLTSRFDSNPVKRLFVCWILFPQRSWDVYWDWKWETICCKMMLIFQTSMKSFQKANCSFCWETCSLSGGIVSSRCHMWRGRYHVNSSQFYSCSPNSHTRLRGFNNLRSVCRPLSSEHRFWYGASGSTTNLTDSCSRKGRQPREVGNREPAGSSSSITHDTASSHLPLMWFPSYSFKFISEIIEEKRGDIESEISFSKRTKHLMNVKTLMLNHMIHLELVIKVLIKTSCPPASLYRGWRGETLNSILSSQGCWLYYCVLPHVYYSSEVEVRRSSRIPQRSWTHIQRNTHY